MSSAASTASFGYDEKDPMIGTSKINPHRKELWEGGTFASTCHAFSREAPKTGPAVPVIIRNCRAPVNESTTKELVVLRQTEEGPCLTVQ
jgi:hypothetical protein